MTQHTSLDQWKRDKLERVRWVAYRIRRSRADDADRLIYIWRAAVDATHQFLTPEDRLALDQEVQRFLPQMPLWLAVDHRDFAIGFMGMRDASMEALFVHPVYHGMGVGRSLVEHALKFHSVLTTTVNEQNEQAIGFYERLGFVKTGRTAIDDRGLPYPLLQLRLEVDVHRQMAIR